jgi:hypothetical protein
MQNEVWLTSHAQCKCLKHTLAKFHGPATTKKTLKPFASCSCHEEKVTAHDYY